MYRASQTVRTLALLIVAFIALPWLGRIPSAVPLEHSASTSAPGLPLLSDFEPKGATAVAYGAYRRAEGVCARALFVIDRDGVIYWSHVAPIGISPGADGILSALEELQDKNKKQDEAQKQHPSTQSEQPVAEQPVEEKYETTIESSHRHSS